MFVGRRPISHFLDSRVSDVYNSFPRNKDFAAKVSGMVDTEERKGKKNVNIVADSFERMR